MFGNKKGKKKRLFSISRLVRGAKGGVLQAELAEELGVSRGTITKDMSVVEKETGTMFWQDDNGRLHWFE